MNANVAWHVLCIWQLYAEMFDIITLVLLQTLQKLVLLAEWQNNQLIQL